MPVLNPVYERKTSPWIILCMKALERQTGRLEEQGCARCEASPSPPPSRSPGDASGCSWTKSQAKCMGDLHRVAKGSAARIYPRLLLGDGGGWRGAREPACGAVLGAAESALGNAPVRCRGARECPGRRADNNKEGIWVRAPAGLYWGCGEGWLVRRRREQPFLGILHLRRVGRGWA